MKSSATTESIESTSLPSTFERHGARAVSTAAALTALIWLSATGCSNSSGPSNTPVATTVQAISGGGQTAQILTQLPEPFVVKVLDQFGNPLSGVTVAFSAFPGGTFGTATPTGDDGLTSRTFTFGQVADSVTITATATGVTTSASFTVYSTGGAPVAIKKLAGDGQIAPAGTTLSYPFVIVVKDIYNNNVAGVTVTWSTDGGTLSTTTTVTDQFGQAKATLTLPSTAGVQQVTAQVEGIAEVHFLATVE